MSKVDDFQEEIRDLLEDKLQQDAVTEWRSKMGQGLYAPRVDVAVGPFAIAAGEHREQEHSHLLYQNIALFRQLTAFHLENLNVITQETAQHDREVQINEKMDKLLQTNQNARCFLAIEIENKVSRKHLMGGAVNGSVLGKIGIAVGFTDKMHRCFLNLYRYFDFCRQVEKPTFNSANLLIVSKEQLMDALSQ
jgi:hypothetical protein